MSNIDYERAFRDFKVYIAKLRNQMDEVRPLSIEQEDSLGDQKSLIREIMWKLNYFEKLYNPNLIEDMFKSNPIIDESRECYISKDD